MSAATAGLKIGRNEPCPCGSGKKYKKCCLPLHEAARPMPAVAEHHPPGASPARPAAGLDIPPYVVARMSEEAAEQPEKLGFSAKLARRIQRNIAEGWTIKKVAAMTTEAILDQLHRYGVDPDQERFLRLARGTTSAWAVSEVWMAQDPIRCHGREEDFLGLAACELWKRWLPETPSMEMLDDWMQEGYRLIQERQHAAGVDQWWRVWQVLRPRFTPEMTTMERAREVFNGYQSLFNWSQDFELEVGNAMLAERRFAAIGRQYCREWLAQFTGESDNMRLNFRRALAEFEAELGDPAEAERILRENIELWPDDPWAYVALSDAFAHEGRRSIRRDLALATAALEQGLVRLPPTCQDYDVLQDRLQALREPPQG